MVMGTPAFMSPEQAKGERADHRVDIYGVGAVLYSTLTGKPPFDEETPHQTVLAVMSSEPTRPRALVPTIPPELELIVQKAMARKPRRAYASMSELDSALARFEEGFVKRVGVRTLSEPPPSIPPRPGSAVDIASELDEARGIRRRAIAWMGLGAALLVVGGLSAAFGVLAELAPNRALLPSELLLATLAVLGSVFTPSLLFLGWLRRSYWNNSARMVGFVTAVRAPVLAGVAVYGIAALLGRGVDALWPHLDASAATPNMSGWVGWAPFLFGAALVAAGGAALRLRLTAHSASLLKRFAGGPVLVAAVSTACAAILISGYEARDPTAATTTASGAPITAEAPAALPLATATPGAAAPPTPVTADPTPSQAASAVSPPPEKDAAPQTDLDVAIAGGVEGLMELRGRYPKDPKVLKPLALELAKSPEQTSELLRVLDVLFAEAPKEVEDRELGRMLYRAALSPTTSQRALELMRTRLGPTGADMLFDIVLNNQELRGRARSALETADVQRNLSPPLKIAYDLYFASTCSARVDLLPQAIKDGDERAIFVLTLFSVKPKSACPKKKPCYAPCGKEAPAMEDAIKQIRARLLASVPKPELAAAFGAPLPRARRGPQDVSEQRRHQALDRLGAQLEEPLVGEHAEASERLLAPGRDRAARQGAELARDDGAHLVTADRQRPGDRGPGELGVLELVLRDAVEDPRERRVRAALGSLADDERRGGLTDAPFTDREPHHGRERRVVEGAIDRERPRSERDGPVRGRQPEGDPGVARLVGHRSRRPRDELGRRADREELKHEAREGADRRVLHERDAGPMLDERRALTRAQRAAGEARRAAPVDAHGRGGSSVLPVDQEGATVDRAVVTRVLASATAPVEGAPAVIAAVRVHHALVVGRLTGEVPALPIEPDALEALLALRVRAARGERAQAAFRRAGAVLLRCAMGVGGAGVAGRRSGLRAVHGLGPVERAVGACLDAAHTLADGLARSGLVARASGGGREPEHQQPTTTKQREDRGRRHARR
jgi:hypothetical protein